MKRKAIQVADSTLLISLPMKWVKKYDIKKGEELDIQIKDNNLIICTEKSIKNLDIDIDISNREKIVHRLISALYKAGYDKLNINFENYEELEIAQKTINNELIGFEVIEENNTFLSAKQISTLDTKEFENMLRRTFYFIQTMSEDTIMALETENTKNLQSLVLRDSNINKLTDYLRRSLNKSGTELFKGRVAPVYFIVETLEKIGDIYRDICKHALATESYPSKDFLSLLKMLNEFFKKFHSLFYKFDFEKLDEFLSEKKEIIDEIEQQIKKQNATDYKYMLLAYNLVNLIYDMNGPLMASVL
jgi:phosphate uptake regulator